MKKSLLIVFVALFAFAIVLGGLVSCKKEKKDTQMFSKADTTAVLELTEEYLNHVMNQEYDKAISMLYDILNDSVRELSPERDSAIREQQKVFPVLAYKKTDMKFINRNKVSVTYSIEFFEKDPDSDIPNTYVITFEPQKIDGKWYLELSKRSHAR